MTTKPYRTTFLDYDARPEPKTEFFCIRCQRDIMPGARHRLVHLVEGGSMILHPEDEAAYRDDPGDLGLHPIGMDCARKIGLEWTHDP